MRKLIAVFLLLVTNGMAAHADQGLINMPCAEVTDYRQDPLVRFSGLNQVPHSMLEDYEHMPGNATQKSRDDKLVSLKLMILAEAQSEQDLVTFYFRHHYPPKSDAIIKPVVKFIQSEAFQKEEKQLPLSQQDIERADVAQVKAIVDHFGKIPLLTQQQMEAYIDEAVYGGSPPAARW